MRRFGFAVAAMVLAIAPTLALDGQPAMHEPSTVIEAGGKFYAYATGTDCRRSSRSTGGRGTEPAR